MCVCVGECGQRGEIRRGGGRKGLGCGEEGWPGEGERVWPVEQHGRPLAAQGSGALEVSADGQDAERELSYSREMFLVTAGGYSEGILSPAWDAHGKKTKNKTCLFAPRGSGYFRNTRNSMFRCKHQPHVTGR